LTRRLHIVYVEEQTSVPSEYLLPYLTEHVDVTLVTSDELIPEGRFRAVHCFPGPKYPMQRLLPARRAVLDVCRHESVDVIHSHAGLAFAMPMGYPLVVHNHGCWFAGWRTRWTTSTFGKRLQLLVGFAHYVIPEWLGLSRASHIVTVSESAKADLLQLYGVRDDRVSVAPNAPDPRLLTYPRSCDEDGDVRITYVGRLTEEKGIPAFLKLFSADPSIRAQMLVIGDGPAGATVRRLAEKDPRIGVLGYRPRAEVYQHLLESSIFVFPSSREGFGMALAEAMAAGNACVALDVPSVREVGGSAIVFCRSIEAMLEQVRLLVRCHESRRDLQEAARARAKTWSWATSAERIVEVYRTVVGS
jgi:glycosyltransferase involved in cell wall biosynthesis